jgi:hypothetical protein
MTKPETPFAKSASTPEPEIEEEAAKKPELPALEGGVSDITRRVKLPPKRVVEPEPAPEPEGEPIDDVFSETETPDEEVMAVEVEAGEWADAEVEMVGVVQDDDPDPEEDGDVVAFETVEPSEDDLRGTMSSAEDLQAAADFDPKPQGELLLEGGPKGKFEGEAPNLMEGEDLDIPPFLRRKK